MSVDPRLIDALEATWPPEAVSELHGCRIRSAPGAGSRVNSIRPLRFDLSDDALAEVEAAATEAAGAPLWALPEALDDARDPASELASRLTARGYEAFDPCFFMTGAPEAVHAAALERRAARVGESEVAALAMRCPLAAVERIWAMGGVGPERLAVMRRAEGPSETFIARRGQRLGGVGFVSVDPATGIAYVHALEIVEQARGKGVGPMIMAASAKFAAEHGAEQLAVSARRHNLPALALFEGVGLSRVGGYVYYRRS